MNQTCVRFNHTSLFGVKETYGQTLTLDRLYLFLWLSCYGKNGQIGNHFWLVCRHASLGHLFKKPVSEKNIFKSSLDYIYLS